MLHGGPQHPSGLERKGLHSSTDRGGEQVNLSKASVLSDFSRISSNKDRDGIVQKSDRLRALEDELAALSVTIKLDNAFVHDQVLRSWRGYSRRQQRMLVSRLACPDPELMAWLLRGWFCRVGT